MSEKIEVSSPLTKDEIIIVSTIPQPSSTLDKHNPPLITISDITPIILTSFISIVIFILSIVFLLYFLDYLNK